MNEIALVIEDTSVELTIFDELTEEEKETLAGFEKEVDLHLVQGFRAGKALTDIHKNSLYRQYATNWNEYLSMRWGMKRDNAQKLISAHAVAEFLIACDQPTPTTTRQALALYYYREPEQRILDLWRVAREEADGNPSGEQIRRIGKQLFPDPKKKASKINVNLESVWEENLIKKLTKQLNTIANRLENCGPRIVPWLKYHAKCVDLIRTAADAIEPFTPHVECPVCHSEKPDCQTCLGTGWLPKSKLEELENV